MERSLILIVSGRSAQRISDTTRLLQLVFNGVISALRAPTELVGALQVQRQLLLEMSHRGRPSCST